jgi:hypothetical protein
MGRHVDGQTEVETKRKLHDLELESKQKLWKWLIVAATGMLIMETWLAGRTDRVSSRNDQPILENAA